EAVDAGDPGVARRVLTAAAEAGAAEPEVQRLEKRVAALEAKPGAKDSDKCDAVCARLAALAGRDLEALVEAAQSVPPTASIVWGTSLVRAVVQRAPYHPGATQWVRERLPKGVEPRGFSDL